MHPTEFWWLAEAKKPPKVYAGGLTEPDVAEIHAGLKSMGALDG